MVVEQACGKLKQTFGKLNGLPLQKEHMSRLQKNVERICELQKNVERIREGCDEVRARVAKSKRVKRELAKLTTQLRAMDVGMNTVRTELELPALQQRWEPAKLGRPRGSSIPGLAEADADVDRIVALWREAFGCRRRTCPPTAVAIAARRYGLSPAQLETYRKNRSKRRV
jgi:hypothetical protein